MSEAPHFYPRSEGEMGRFCSGGKSVRVRTGGGGKTKMVEGNY